MRGAGGTEGGTVRFFLGLAMIVVGGYLFFSSIRVLTPGWGMGSPLYSFWGLSLTSGMILIPFAFGVALIFFNARNLVGWFLTIGSLLALSAGVIATVRLSLARMSFFDLAVILVLLVGGVGLFLGSLRDLSRA
ncbi:MAG TPA: hypothetical protein VLV83_03470 [Acidobacteriota bacterium]|nr:hypothetical protein [Acidobacteriota bacterium]